MTLYADAEFGVADISGRIRLASTKLKNIGPGVDNTIKNLNDILTDYAVLLAELEAYSGIEIGWLGLQSDIQIHTPEFIAIRNVFISIRDAIDVIEAA